MFSTVKKCQEKDPCEGSDFTPFEHGLLPAYSHKEGTVASTALP